MAADGNFDDLLGRLRRQTVMSPQHGDPLGSQSQQSQQQQQQQQQSHQPHPLQQQQNTQSVHGIHPPPPLHLSSIPPPSQQFRRDSESINSPGLHQSQPGFPASHHPQIPLQPLQKPTPQATAESGYSSHFPSHLFPQNVPPPRTNPMSPTVDGSNPSRTASLLQLLKFSQAVPAAPTSEISQPPIASPSPRPPVASPPPTSQQHSSHNRTVSASDLVASLLRRSTEPPIGSGLRQENIAPGAVSESLLNAKPLPERQTPVNPQDLVLQLLGRPKPSQDDLPNSDSTVPRNNAPPERRPSQGPTASDLNNQNTRSPIPTEPRPMSVPPAAPPKSPHQPHVLSTPFSNPTPSKGLFTYVNPFEQLHATSPRNRTPRSPNSVGTGKSTLGTREVRTENAPLPFSPTTSLGRSEPPPAYTAIGVEAAGGASTASQALKEEEEHDTFGSATLDDQPARELQESSQSSPKPSPEQPGNGARDSVTNGAPSPETPGEEQDDENVPPGTHDQDDEEDDNYESASEAQGSPVLVYNFPMKPFSSITINPSTALRPKFPISKISDIARMPRSFDQLDRNLIAASHQFIAYAISKSHDRGGIRVLRQFDGKDKVLMRDSTDRTFNVTISNGDRILGTGMSGAVVWAELGDFDRSDWSGMFIFPPSEEQGQSNGVLKSRARKTCRQMDVFAIGRGKTISIIHAPTAKAYAQRKSNEVASRKYLADHTRTIDTGKASKDFTFSDDDSVIISIDKAGKLKLWDVQDLISFPGNDPYNSPQPVPAPQPSMVLTNPILMFSAVAAGESYRATSVMFLDKFRPYHKCLALRYVVVGMKQNHTLQLWDLALGRPVQEINFPQESDTDALCSVVYHPMTGIIVVGNPTRNSIYFIHLSAPKYNLPVMSQAQYIRSLAVKDANIPKPDATAILSGLREYSFASKGQLMSLDILDGDGQGEIPPLFELYVAHSKGMTALSVFKEDLGWDSKNSARNPVDAVKEGVCTLTNMTPPPPPEKDRDSDMSMRSDKSAKSDRAIEKAEKVEKPKLPEKTKSSDVAEASEAAEKSADVLPDQGLKPSPPENAPKGPAKSRSVSPGARGADIVDGGPVVPNGNTKRKRKDRGNSQPPVGSFVSSEEHKSDKILSVAPKPRGALATIPGGESDAVATLSTAFLDREIKKFEKSVSTEFTKVMNRELTELYRRFDEDKRIQQAAGEAKQDAILRLLSSTLTDNVEQVIGRIVMTNIQESVLPAITNVTSVALEKSIGESISRSLDASLPGELHAILPDAIRRTLNQTDFLSRISDAISRPITHSVEQEISRAMHNSILPNFKQLAIDAADKVAVEADRKQNEAFAALELIRQQDSQKIDQLMNTVKALTDTVAAMAKSQAEFQDQVQRAQAEYVQAYEQGPPEPEARASTRVPTPPPAPSPEELEAEETERFLRNGRYEEGTIKWLQSKERQAELFDEVVVRYRYDFLPNLSQLVLLSVSAAVSIKFENKVYERLSWLEGVLAVLDPMDPEIHEICHRIMAVVVQRLEQLYMSTAEKNMSDPILRKIPSIARRARELSSMAA